MAFDIMDHAFKFDTGDRNTNYVLVTLAWFANYRSKKCWPSITRLGKTCHMNRHSVIKCLKLLNELGVIQISKMKGGSNHYQFTDEWLKGSGDNEVVPREALGSAQVGTGVVPGEALVHDELLNGGSAQVGTGVVPGEALGVVPGEALVHDELLNGGSAQVGTGVVPGEALGVVPGEALEHRNITMEDNKEEIKDNPLPPKKGDVCVKKNTPSPNQVMADKLLVYFREKLGGKSRDTKPFVTLLANGFSEDDIKLVIDWIASEWKNVNQGELSPLNVCRKTLFAGKLDKATQWKMRTGHNVDGSTDGSGEVKKERKIVGKSGNIYYKMLTDEEYNKYLKKYEEWQKSQHA
ncbi:helix-turn-helix domain-containing protein [Escherichia coli]